MAQGNLQTSWDSPKFTIDCVLTNVSGQLQADGCVLACVEDGHKLTTPDHVKAGDFVNVQLWLEGEEAFIDIRLAEVRRVYKHWITVEVIQLSPNDRMRLRRFTMSTEESGLIDHLLIRA
jgi:hypothetical protein